MIPNFVYEYNGLRYVLQLNYLVTQKSQEMNENDMRMSKNAAIKTFKCEIFNEKNNSFKRRVSLTSSAVLTLVPSLQAITLGYLLTTSLAVLTLHIKLVMASTCPLAVRRCTRGVF